MFDVDFENVLAALEVDFEDDWPALEFIFEDDSASFEAFKDVVGTIEGPFFQDSTK